MSRLPHVQATRETSRKAAQWPADAQALAKSRGVYIHRHPWKNRYTPTASPLKIRSIRRFFSSSRSIQRNTAFWTSVNAFDVIQ